MCDEIVPFMAQGFSKMALAAHLGINEETLYAWIKRHPAFSKAIKDGSLQSALWWERRGMEGMMGEIPGFNATTWIFNMKNRHGWADKTDVNHGGQTNNPVTVIQLVPLHDDSADTDTE